MGVIHAGTVINQETGADVDFEVVHGQDRKLAALAEIRWQPYFAQQIIDLKNHADNEEQLEELLAELGTEHSHWNWVKKAIVFVDEGYEWFYLKSDNDIEAIAVIYHPKESRIDSESVYYIEYVASAPWNRPSPIHGRKLSGVGSKLIEVISEFAADELNLRPGFCLHSLPQTISYYENIGMTDFGPDAGKENLHFFEMSKEECLAMLGRSDD